MSVDNAVPQAGRVRRRLESKSHHNVERAFWELFLHEALKRTGFEWSLSLRSSRAQPLETSTSLFRTPGRRGLHTWRPPWQATQPAVRARRKRLNAAWDEVNRAAPPGFFISVAVDHEGSQAPSGCRLREKRSSRGSTGWIEQLSPRHSQTVLARTKLPEKLFTIDDWRFGVRALPMTDDGVASADDSTPLIGIGPMEMTYGGSGRAIRRALDRKRPSRYGALDRPYVIALHDTHLFADTDEAINALFGASAIQLTFRGDKIVKQETVRSANGFWRENRNTSVAAVVYARRLTPWFLATAEIQVIPNPWASRALTIELPWART